MGTIGESGRREGIFLERMSPSQPSPSPGKPDLGGPQGRPDEAYDIRIARDGTWFHEGAPIGRKALVKLFASVLRRDAEGDYWLVTPAERGRIAVEDAPFIAVAADAAGSGADQRLTFRTNLDHEVTAGPDHPIRVAHDALSGEPSPYILIRDRLAARIARPVFYELVDRAVARETGKGTELGLWSGQIFFPLGSLPSEDSPR